MTALVSRRSILQAAALLPGLALPRSQALAATGGFTHSVASGDPQQRSVVLWTRFVPNDGGAVTLRVELADDERFTRPFAIGDTEASPATDFCARAVPDGLRPGHWYYYRFIAPGGATSPVGRTRTLPAGPLQHVRVGVFSCSNATSGWFNAYAHAAARNDLDLIIHTGDYIYESPVDRSDALARLAVSRGIQPRGEAVSLADYRQRYASYRADPSLMGLHRRFPMIVLWDDHEVANNSWHGGAANHDVREGAWKDRAAAAVRAFREWLPMRYLDYARYQIGDLATLFRLETRLLARCKQLELDPGLVATRDPERAVKAFREGPLADPARTLLGARQEAWLAESLAGSTAIGTRWQLLAQQVVMAPMRLPEVTPAWFAPGTTRSPSQQSDLARAVAMARLGLPMGLDRWDGYPAARARLLESAARAGANLIVLSGDSHNGWAYDLAHRGRPAGVEFAGQSVSSLGIERRFDGDPRTIARDFIATNPGLKWCDTSRRGYMILDLTPEYARNEWLFLPSRNVRSIEPLGRHQIIAEHGAEQLTAT